MNEEIRSASKIKIADSVLFCLGIAFLIRLTPAIFSVITGDVKFHLSYVLSFLYSPDVLHSYGSIKALYHNPPLWILVESLTYVVSVKTGISFAVLIKVWPILADLGITLLLWKWFGNFQKGKAAAWFYALNPVSIIVSGFHGQFDPVVIFTVLAALFFLNRAEGRTASSADFAKSHFFAYLLLGVAIALKDYPVLLLPFFFIVALRAKLQWQALVLMVFPSLSITVPFLLADTKNVLEALFLYSGSPDFGLGGVLRLIRWTGSGFNSEVIANDFPRVLFTIMKLGYLAFWFWAIRDFYRRNSDIIESSMIVFLGFLIIYPGISAQYLYWPIPLMILKYNRSVWAYSWLAVLAMSFFYLAYFPRILLGYIPVGTPPDWFIPVVSGCYLLANFAWWLYSAFRTTAITRKAG